MKRLFLGSIVLVAFVWPVAGDSDPDAFVAAAPRPREYVLSSLRAHEVVIFGEAHWIREEVTLVRDLVPLLPDNGTHTLAMEIFPASMQGLIDEVVSADQWDEAAAMTVLRGAGMPHEEYLQIIERVWKTRREKGDGSLRLLALGPGHDWREHLPEGETYDSFMAGLVKRALAGKEGSVLVYTGLHHAFTRYMQPETTNDGRVRAFMVRMGNLLRWELGDRVFAITTHRPIQCRAGEGWKHCEPFGGAIDCAASRAGGRPFGFEVAPSPFAELRFAAHDLYVPGYPDLRLVDFVDGLLWVGPPDGFHQTTIIPLDRYAPSREALESVSDSNPFDDRTGLSLENLEDLWHEEENRLAAPILGRRWQGVGEWRALCTSVQP